MNACQRLPDKIRIARSFGRAAGSYDDYARPQREIADKLIDNLTASAPPEAAASILDLGSGTGYCATRLQAEFPRAKIFNLDIAEPMLAQARGRGNSACEYWVCGDGEELPFGERLFDLVVSNLTLQWCQNPQRVFSELYRVMRPGSQAWISTLARNTLKELRESWASVDSHVHVNSFLSVSEIEEAARKPPFSSVRVLNGQEVFFYPSLTALTAELKGIGAHNLNSGQSSGLTGKEKLVRLKTHFEANAEPGKGIPVTYDMVMVHLVKQES